MPDDADFFPGFETPLSSRPTPAASSCGSPGPGRRSCCCTAFRKPASCGTASRRKLAERFTVVVPDLRGYGWSSAPASHGRRGLHEAGHGHRRRGRHGSSSAMPASRSLGTIAGRTGRLPAWRSTIPAGSPGLRCSTSLPTMEVWRAMEKGGIWFAALGLSGRARAQAGNRDRRRPGRLLPRPDEALGGATTLDAFDPRGARRLPRRLGRSVPRSRHLRRLSRRRGQDRAADEADEAAGKTITCPVQILGSSDYLTKLGQGPPLEIWRRPCPGGDRRDDPVGPLHRRGEHAGTLAALEAFLTAG